MIKLAGYPFDYLSPIEKQTAWAITKLLDGLTVKNVKNILECIKILIDDTEYKMSPIMEQNKTTS